MKIQIKKENYKELVQCVYLGNLIINEYRKSGEEKKEYFEFLKSILMQIVKATPKAQAKFKLHRLSYEKTQDNMLSDLIDGIEDSVKDYYEEFRKQFFEEMLIEKLPR